MSVSIKRVVQRLSLFNDLFAGRYDLVSTTSDNVINRVVNSNLPLELVAGFDRGSDLV
jgi:hypothetical protein